MDPHHHRDCRRSHHGATYSCCCSCYSTCYNVLPPDPLLHHPPPPPPSYYYSHSSQIPPPQNPPNYPHHYYQTPYPIYHHQKQEHFEDYSYHRHHQRQSQAKSDQSTVSSLLRRIAALESSLSCQFPPKSTSLFSLRDAAARTIQTHFRAFLVRRSRTLSQLKDLAAIKSSLNSLKTCASGNAHADAQAISRKTMDLLLKIDSIQGSDPMIRAGKKSISRDLVRFLGLIGGLPAKSNKLSRIGLKNLKTRVLYHGQENDTIDFLSSGREVRDLEEQMRAHDESSIGFSSVPEDDDREAVELDNIRIPNYGKILSLPRRNGGLAKRQGGEQGKVKKTVRFAEDGNVSRAFVSKKSSEDGSVDEEELLVDNLCGDDRKIDNLLEENEDDNGEDHAEDEESSPISNGGGNPRRNSWAEGNYRVDKGNHVFSAPVPVKMETRADLMKRKALKIVE